MFENQIDKPAGRWRHVPLRVTVLLILAYVIGALLTRVSGVVSSTSQPAGFRVGVIQGALMPMSFPNLLVGRDVTIYSLHNTGISYKLGYTTGVNGCGALFFGFLYWRVSRWRKRAASGKAAA